MSEEVARIIEKKLSKVYVPGFDVDVISSGVVKSFRISKDGEKVLVLVDFSGSDPGCLFCRFINQTLWRAISNNIKEALKEAGLREVTVIDSRTNQVL
ncbi:MAG: hypothetical protein RMH77_07295 [Sulfolobales archaeon]|nr:hypothetical protein [Sulfolobales archaeon]MCX8186579.1 hypothetical protein [Sulfolobales archaeon]MDW7970184.1 hypothetical protein [Sulfolobales archaeon]